ncbi:MAG: hypothetical protein MRT15_04015 [archaeon YNP-LCB-003-016]|uniref:hypothetical protein n=1 Tax=Candidatus Culexarchaeum yellowstonense TaxID=2928963 RepID=UPI0026F2F83D|nr:hypothetical protein [Candidatus Culexarchaeum yellowstonense]MCR6691534.1 hypothetical protein [Candidatus Culexarchaeum yellowstonense]
MAEANVNEQIPKWLQELIANSSGEIAGLIGSIIAIATGAGLMLDDYKDFGLDGTERDPPMPHHWLLGSIVLIGGVMGACASGLSILKKLKEFKFK